MAILVSKLVCGNCEQNKDGVCQIDGVKVSPLSLYCFRIFRSFVDKGFELEVTDES